MATSISHLKEVRLLITQYKLKVQCRDTQTKEPAITIKAAHVAAFIIVLILY